MYVILISRMGRSDSPIGISLGALDSVVQCTVGARFFESPWEMKISWIR